MKCLFTLLILVFVFVSTLNCYSNFVFAQQETPGSEHIVVTGFKKVGQAMPKIFNTLKNLSKRGYEWLRAEVFSPNINAWIEKKKIDIKAGWEEEKQEFGNETKKTFSKLWQWLKDLVQ